MDEDARTNARGLDWNVLRQAFCSGLVISSAFLLDIGIDWWFLGCSRSSLEDRRSECRCEI